MYWHWHQTFWRRKDIDVQGIMFWLATLPVYKTAKTVMIPFEMVAQKMPKRELTEEQIRKKKQKSQESLKKLQAMLQEDRWETDNLHTLENAQLFTKRVQQVKKNNQIIVVVTQDPNKIAQNPQQKPKGYLIVAPLTSRPCEFFSYFRRYFKIKETESITLIQTTEKGTTTVSPEARFESLALNDKGHLDMEIIRMEAMG